MKIYKISLGHIIPLFDNYYLLRANNNKWTLEFISFGNRDNEVSFDVLTSRGKQGAIKTLFTI